MQIAVIALTVLLTATLVLSGAALIVNHNAAGLKPVPMVAPDFGADSEHASTTTRPVATRATIKALWIRTHNRDFETFMPALLQDAVRNGGYVNSHRLGLAWPPYVKDSITLLTVPAQYAQQLEELRDPDMGHVTPNYREWLETHAKAAPVNNQNDMTMVTIYGQRQYMPTAGHAQTMETIIWCIALTMFLMIFAIMGAAAMATPEKPRRGAAFESYR